MELEDSIVERLQKLRQWQIEQQEKLLKHQRIQREILSQEQDRIYKALGLSMTSDMNSITKNIQNKHAINEIEINTGNMVSEATTVYCNTENLDNAPNIHVEEILLNGNESYKDHKEEETEELPNISVVIDKNKNTLKNSDLSQKEELSTNILIERTKSLSLHDITSDKHLLIDDIPVPSPKKNFQELLEERLKNETEVKPNVCTDKNDKMKRPFLKKGQGLLRFKISENSQPLVKNSKKHNTLSSNNAHMNKIGKYNKSTMHKNIASAHPNSTVNVTAMQKLNLKSVPLPKKNIQEKKIEATTPIKPTLCNSIQPNQLKCLPKINISDFDVKTEKELEEVRIFELLEEKAENSSFCSTSSTVLAFLQQSTPFKIKKRLNYAESGGDIAVNVKQQNQTNVNNIIELKLIDQTVHRNSEQNIQLQSDQFNISKSLHNDVVATTSNNADPYWDIEIVDDMETTQKYVTIPNQISHGNETHKDYLQNHEIYDARDIADSSEEERFSIKDRQISSYDRETDTNHRVRFSKYNEYINLIDMCNTSNESSLKDSFFERRDGNERCVNASHLSNIEEKLKSEIENSSNISNNEDTINSSILLSLRHNITKDSYHRVKKITDIPTETQEGEDDIDIIPNSKDELPNNEDIDDGNECASIFQEIVRTSDDDQSILLSSPSSVSLSSSPPSSNVHGAHINTYDKKEYVFKSELENVADDDVYENIENIKHYSPEGTANHANTFEPELLKRRLLELEKEINIFRKESSTLLFQRRKLQEDQATLRKEYTEKEKNFEENKKRIQNQLQEEKKRIAREKIAMENRIRYAQEKAKQNKMERYKMQHLQEQLDKLKDELNIKESKWNITESRYKSQLRALNVEISKLKQEITTLRNVKKTRISNTKKINGQLNTKAINEINKRVTAMSSKNTFAKTPLDVLSDVSIHSESDSNKEEQNDDNLDNNKDDDKDDNDTDKDTDKDKSLESIVKTISANEYLNQIKNNVVLQKKDSIQVKIGSQLEHDQKFMERNIAKEKRNLYKDLLKDATLDLVENQGPYRTQNVNNVHMPLVTQPQNSQDNKLSRESNDKACTSSIKNDDDYITDFIIDDKGYFNKSRRVSENRSGSDVNMQNKGLYSESTECLNSPLNTQADRHHVSKTNAKNVVKQINHSDGRIEYWYPNGNVKKIFPDQGVTKLIYYNGDVRETDRDGKVKYFYATARTWHTTTMDGLEILEFPDGQVEKRSSDGTIEVSFPDGATRIAQVDGTEKWALPDGTIAQIFTNGDKILILPNGQREIHTKAHKRREYPDGTVKLVYADGTQETHYSSGRKRLKDKDGNLLMDSYDV